MQFSKLEIKSKQSDDLLWPYVQQEGSAFADVLLSSQQTTGHSGVLVTKAMTRRIYIFLCSAVFARSHLPTGLGIQPVVAN